MAEPKATPIGPGVVQVVHDGRADIVYVAGTSDDRWAFSNGRVYHVTAAPESPAKTRSGSRPHVSQALSAPMPATVASVSVQPGARVRKGDTILVLEAMKMELPLRAPADAQVVAVNCRVGELVQPGTLLVELE